MLENFYTIKNVFSSDKHLVEVELNASHPIYKGPFPGNPVMPGVCMTQVVKELTEHITGKKLQLVTGDNLKFTAVLNPNEHSNVNVSISFKTKENGLLHTDAGISSGDISFFSFKGSFRSI